MPFLPPNQQRQSTEGKALKAIAALVTQLFILRPQLEDRGRITEQNNHQFVSRRRADWNK